MIFLVPMSLSKLEFVLEFRGCACILAVKLFESIRGAPDFYYSFFAHKTEFDWFRYKCGRKQSSLSVPLILKMPNSVVAPISLASVLQSHNSCSSFIFTGFIFAELYTFNL